MVGKLMGGALGMTLVVPTHRYAGVTPHLTPEPSAALRHATRAGGAARAVWQFIQASYCIIMRWDRRVLAVWGGLESSCHSPKPPGRDLYHDIRAKNVVWNSIVGHGACLDGRTDRTLCGHYSLPIHV